MRSRGISGVFVALVGLAALGHGQLAAAQEERSFPKGLSIYWSEIVDHEPSENPRLHYLPWHVSIQHRLN